ncbi:hypothetical protein V498_01027 [Pseudogymnoascus sp. VKM F-4517 (FW-2822)]|nr:hypothetical protein V498_01027 [Pseudogymnoascus sp. VKM F-4517 (FW-2822)]
MASTDAQRGPWKPYYYVTHVYGPETTVSSKFEMCTPDGEGLPKPAAMEEQPFSGPKPSSPVSSTATATILASDKRDTSEDRLSRKREYDRKMQQKKRHEEKQYIRSLQEQRDSLLEHRISTMNLSERNERLEKENAQLMEQLNMLQREGMVQNHTLVAPESYPFLVMASDSATNERTH